MPYIKQELRPPLDEVVEKIVSLELSNEEWLLLLNAFSTLNGYMYLNWVKVNKCKDLFMETKDLWVPDGSINYIIFKYAKYYIKPSYNNYKNFMGVLYDAVAATEVTQYKNEYREAAEWIRLMLLLKYEMERRRENGDV